MKKLFSLFLAAIVSFSSFALNPSPDLILNSKSGILSWVGYKVGGQHSGTIDIKSGKLNWDGKSITGGEITIDMSSMASTDLKGEWADKLIGHLKSEDFFGVDKFSEAKFIISGITFIKGNTYEIKGDLTIKGITKEFVMNAEIVNSNNQLTIKGTTKVDRTKYNVRYGSKSFFDDLGDKYIEDLFDFSFELSIKL